MSRSGHARLLTRVRELPATMRVLDELTTSYDVADDAEVSAALTTCRAEFALASGDAGGAFAEANAGLGLTEGAGAHTLLPDLHVVLTLNAVRQFATSTGPGCVSHLVERLISDDHLMRELLASQTLGTHRVFQLC
ncbi:hypothetical protein [Streptomyces olivaceus]|uniref:hypothetical protein n=1 Tax=Streptomyces olivaceus TaxID=47716 RepID=UPI0022ED6C9A|nr:hypothetical protein [Streptomyces olivaceus]GHI97948.1 hypothetical protein TPA0905_74190 [Streptomyces olivaceus]